MPSELGLPFDVLQKPGSLVPLVRKYCTVGVTVAAKLNETSKRSVSSLCGDPQTAGESLLYRQSKHGSGIQRRARAFQKPGN